MSTKGLRIAVQIALEAAELPTERVALNGHIEPTKKLLTALLGASRLLGQQDQPSTRACTHAVSDKEAISRSLRTKRGPLLLHPGLQ